MKYRVFAVFDAKLAVFGQPFFEMKRESAIRSFGDAVNDGSNPANMWHRHPEDFSLYELGEYESDTGSLVSCVPCSLVTASALRSLVASGVKDACLNGDKQLELPV